MSGHSWPFLNAFKGVTESCLALGSLLLLERAQGTSGWTHGCLLSVSTMGEERNQAGLGA